MAGPAPGAQEGVRHGPDRGQRRRAAHAGDVPAVQGPVQRDHLGLYGLTEAGPAVTSNAAGERARAGSIGLPIPGLEVRLIEEHAEGLEDVEEGDPGEIVVKGPAVFRGYWGKDDATAEMLTDGWLRTGDVGYADEDGYLFLVDRTKDLIIVSGFNVFPKEVEDALCACPACEDAVVIGVPDNRTGEAVKALVVWNPASDATRSR